jgi:hypothetical protein
MNKILIICALLLSSLVKAEIPCPRNFAGSSSAADQLDDSGKSLGCKIEIAPEDQYQPVACEQYKNCIDSQHIPPDELDAKRKLALPDLAKKHFEMLYLDDRSYRAITRLAIADKFSKFLLATFPKETGNWMFTNQLCQGQSSLTPSEKCELSVLNPQTQAATDNMDTRSSKFMPSDILVAIEYNSSKLSEITATFLKQFNPTEPNVIEMKKWFDQQIKKINELYQNPKTHDIKGKIFESIYNLGTKMCAQSADTMTVQQRCESATRVLRGKADFLVEGIEASNQYINENPKPGIFTKMFRCEALNVSTVNDSMGREYQDKKREVDRKWNEEQKLLPPPKTGNEKSYFDPPEVIRERVQSISNMSVGSSTATSNKFESTATKSLTVASPDVGSIATPTDTSSAASAFSQSSASRTSQNNFTANTAYATQALPTVASTDTRAISGTAAIAKANDGVATTSGPVSAASDAIAAQLKSAQAEIASLKQKDLDSQKRAIDEEKALLTKQKDEFEKQKSQTAVKEAIVPVSTNRNAIASQDSRETTAEKVAAAPVAVAGNQATDQASADRPAPSATSGSKAASKSAAGEVTDAASRAGLGLVQLSRGDRNDAAIATVEIPKGVSAIDFIREQILKNGIKPFVMIDSEHGNLEVTPAKGKDGKPVRDENGNYIYVTRPVKKNISTKEKAKEKVEPKAVVKVQTPTPTQTYFYKEFDGTKKILDEK